MTPQQELIRDSFITRLVHPPLAIAPMRGDRCRLVNASLGMDTGVRFQAQPGEGYRVLIYSKPWTETITREKEGWTGPDWQRFEHIQVPRVFPTLMDAIEAVIEAKDLTRQKKPLASICERKDHPDPKSHADAAKILGKRDRAKLAHNTYLIRRGDWLCIRFHNTDILDFHRNGNIRINHGFWQTVTTMERIRRFLPTGWRIGGDLEHRNRTRDVGDWHVTTPAHRRGEVFYFRSWIELNRWGRLVDRNRSRDCI